MDNATKFGYTFEIIRGYRFKKAILFKEYVEKMYKLRKSYPKDHPLNLIDKLLMNSLYGKLGMKPEGSRVDILNTTNPKDMDNLEFNLNTLGDTISDYIELGQHLIIVRKNISRYNYNEKEDLYHGLDVNIAIASSITAGVELE